MVREISEKYWFNSVNRPFLQRPILVNEDNDSLPILRGFLVRDLGKYATYFTNESLLVSVKLILSSLTIRLRGKIYKCAGAFAGQPERIVIGSNLTLKAGKLICVSGNLKIGSNCRIEVFSEGYSAPKLIFGRNFALGNNVHIACANSISIGSDVLFGSNILVTDHNHGDPKLDIQSRSIVPPTRRPLTSKGPIIIEDGVWICDLVTILGNVTIGTGSIIPAGSVVRHDVPANSIFKG